MERVPSYTVDAFAKRFDSSGDLPARTDRLRSRFAEVFGGAAPDLVARSPGRVNLIGEHVDYEGYSVLPMAIALDTLVAIRRVAGGSGLTVANVDTTLPTREYAADPSQAVSGGDVWSNYVLCAFKGVWDHVAAAGLAPPAPCGLELVVEGRVPMGAGLSSSSALVCASTVAIMAAYNLDIAKTALAELTRACERYIGTMSGGMDQAISIMGFTKMVHFNPVRADEVTLPDGAAFVVANSLTVSKKADASTTNERYNLRVVECRLASMLCAFARGLAVAKARTVETLGEVDAMSGGIGPALEVVKAALKAEPYTLADAESVLGVAPAECFKESAASLTVLRERGAGAKCVPTKKKSFSFVRSVSLFSIFLS